MANPQEELNQALQLHQAGRIDEAIDLYTKVLPQMPDNPRLLFLLGTARLQAGQHESCIDLMRRVLRLEPQNLLAHINQGNALLALQRYEEAAAAFERALAVKPDFPEAHNNRGAALRKLGRLEEALATFERALLLKPDYVEAHNNRGNVLKDLKRLEDALASYDRALALRPDDALAHNNRGAVLDDLGRAGDALASFEQALTLHPDYAEAHFNRGNALQDLGRMEESLAAYVRALALNPRYAEAHNNSGHSLNELGRREQALASFEHALALNPDYAEAHNNRGTVLADLGRIEDALASFEKALALRPDYAGAHFNRGSVLQDLRRMEEALASYDRALALKPDDASAHWNKALFLILTGRYPEGWELYEWRFKKKDMKHDYYTSLPQPAWRGRDDIRGKRIFVYGEQGFGDVIQFCRYLPRLEMLGASIVFEVTAPLLSLVATLDCPMTLKAKGEPLPAFDVHCPLASLPYAFGTTVETIPAETPYLHADADKVGLWRQRLGRTDRLRVGVAWSGATAHRKDAFRSIPLQELLPLIGMPVEWHALQKEYREHDLPALDRHPEIHQHQDELRDFADTAALIACMDLVISVDTGVAHLAGAMGKPVWILLPFVPDYRWMLDRTDSPWYPTARLFRQPAPGDWPGAIAETISALGTLAQSLPRSCKSRRQPENP